MQQLERFVGFEVVKEVSPDWEKLALALHLRGEIIREQRHLQPEAACRNILQRWLSGDGRQPVTWDTLLDCLEDTLNGTLAGYLRKVLVPAKDDSVDTTKELPSMCTCICIIFRIGMTSLTYSLINR